MKKKITIFALCLAMISTVFIMANAALTNQSADDELFLFDSSKHTVHSPEYTASGYLSDSFEEFNNLYLTYPDTAIIIGEVTGPSINRIIHTLDYLRNPNAPIRFNFVITPILIHHIVSLGEEFTDVKVGEIINVSERYYYVTPETTEQEHLVGNIVTHFSTWPMEKGNLYLIHLHESAYDSEYYRYNGEVIASAFFKEMIYLLDPISPARVHTNNETHPHYSEWWQDAMAKYGHLASQVIWPEHPESIINRLVFNIGSDLNSRTSPDNIDPIDVPAGFNLPNYLEINHEGFPTDGPTRPGYEFAGWYLDDNFTTLLTETFRMPARDVTLHAKWEPDEDKPILPPLPIQIDRLSAGSSITMEIDADEWLNPHNPYKHPALGMPHGLRNAAKHHV